MDSYSLGVGFLSFGMVGSSIHVFRPFGVVHGFYVSSNSNISHAYEALMQLLCSSNVALV